MTVGELITELQALPPEAPVVRMEEKQDGFTPPFPEISIAMTIDAFKTIGGYGRFAHLPERNKVKAVILR